MGIWGAFAQRPFRLLWSASLLMQIGYWFLTITFQWALPHHSDDDAALLGLLYFCTFLPYLLFALPSGAAADKYDRRRLLIVTQAGATALGIACLTLSAAELLTPAVVLAAGFASGCVIVFVSPASQAFIANTVPADHLSAAISLQSVSLNVARITGPSIAGILLVSGTSAAFATYAAVSVLALTLLGLIRMPPRPVITTAAESLLLRVRAGMVHARERRPSVAVLSTVALASIFGSAYQSQLAILGSHVSSDGDTAFIVIVVTGGVGALIAVLLIARRNRKPTLGTTVGGLLLLGATEALMGIPDSYAPMLILITIAGGATFWTMTCSNIVLQHLVDDEQRGRVMSLYFLCWGGLLPFGGIGIGAGISAFGSPLGFGAFGLAALIGGIVVAILHRPGQPVAPSRVDAI